jgi:hypothetical protein
MTTVGTIGVIVILWLMVAVDGLAVSNGKVGGWEDKRIYGVAHSGWRSPQWNWGSAVGTGHDCARICRQEYNSRDARRALIKHLLTDLDIPADFEEVKLVLALSWQKARWDSRDGGQGGYGEVLKFMAEAERYEIGSLENCSRCLIQDMGTRFHCLQPSQAKMTAMQELMTDYESDINRARRRCSGLVLESMGFVEHGC